MMRTILTLLCASLVVALMSACQSRTPLADPSAVPVEVLSLQATQAGTPPSQATTSTPNKTHRARPTQGVEVEKALHSTDIPTPTRAPSPTPTPTPPFSEGQYLPDCEIGPDFTHCYDEILQIEFEYPSRLGTIQAELRRGWDSGYAYDYAFASGHIAGGRSRDFGEGRESMLTDFFGFRRSSQGWCTNYYEDPTACVEKEIQPGVVWLYGFPSAASYCKSAPGLNGPLNLVLVDLPDGPMINGFLFIPPFLSDKDQGALNESLGISEADDQIAICDEEHSRQYRAWVEQFLSRLEQNSLDGSTRENMVNALHLAESIRIK